ncbi:uncharacterized protein [Eucyclogobius newberryi]|uniref:uncharacterized protein n=1 Tax=Eucyclogobius newberryi TaxID=166745 RepID=UPI003B5AA1BE
MGLPAGVIAAALCIVGSLVLAAAPQDGDFQVGLFPPCSATLAPERPCEGEGDDCPFVFNLPPMTVNLPKQLLDLERLAEELQMLKDNVDELRQMCKSCAAGRTEKQCAQGADRDADNGNLDVNAQIRENNKRIMNEKRGENGKTLAKDKMEQVVAEGKNVRITERKKLDRKQIERDGAAKGALDKQKGPLCNASHMQNRTFGKSERWRDQMMDSKGQTEAADETEEEGAKRSNGNEESDGQKLHVKAISDEKDTKSDHPTKYQADVTKTKDGNAKPSSGGSIDGHIWRDKHHRTSHENGAGKHVGNVDEGSTEQPIDRDRPVWRDKTHVDMNQMERLEERGRGTSDASKEGGTAPKSSPSGRHVWPDETMETSSSAEKIKMSVSAGGGDGDTGQEHRRSGEGKEGGERLREFENRRLMEGTGSRSGGQASVVNSAPSHGFIDLDGPVTLTSPPSFTASHLTTDAERGQREKHYGKGSTKEQLRFDAELGGDGGELGNGGERNVDVGQLEQPGLEIGHSYDEGKVDIDEQYRPTKTAPLDTRSKSDDLSMDLKNVRQILKGLPKNGSANFERTNQNKAFVKQVKQLAKIPNRFLTTGSTTFDLSKEDHKSTSKPPSQATQERDIYTEDSNVDGKESTNKNSGKESEAHDKTKMLISKTVSTKDGSETTTSPTASDAHVMDVERGGPKTAFGRPSQNNQGKKHRVDEESTQISREDSKVELTISTLDTTTSNAMSDLTDFKQDKPGNEPESEGNDNKVHSEHSSSKGQIYQPSATTSTPTLSTLYLTKDIKHGDEKASYSPSQNNSNEKASDPMSSGDDTRLLQTQIQLTTVALTEDSASSTPTPQDSHLGQNVKQQQQQIPDNKQTSQSNQKDNKHSSHSADKAKDEQYVTISIPTTSNFEQENQNTFNGKLSQSDRDIEHSNTDASFIKATNKPNVVNEDAGGFNSITSNSEITTFTDKQHGETTEHVAFLSTINKDLEKESSSFDVAAKVNPVQPTTELAEDTTTSKPRFNSNSNQGQQETAQKTQYGQPSTNSNKNSIQDAQMDSFTTRPASALVEDITSSSHVRSPHASFRDDITSTAFTSHQISPTTTLPPIPGSKKKISGSKSVPKQKTKLNPAKKPEANLKLKNPKNDRKPDHTPSLDTRVKNDRRLVHPKVRPSIAPAQIPPDSDQNTQLQVNGKDNPLPSAPPIQTASSPVQTPTDAPTMTSLLRDERKRTNATSMHDRRQTMDSEIDTTSGSKQFIKKVGNMLNNTGNIMLAQNRSSGFNGTKESSKKSPKTNLKIPQINLKKPKPQVPKNKTAHLKLESNRKVKVEQAPKAKFPKVNKFVDLKNSSKVSPGPKTQTKPVKSKITPAAKIKQTLKLKEKIAKSDAVPTSDPIELTTLNSKNAHDLEAERLRPKDATSERLTMNPNSGVISGKGPQTTDPVTSIALTTEPNKATQESATPPTKIDLNQGENSPSSPSKADLRPTVHPVFRSTAPPAPRSGAKVPAVVNTTPSARELRVKINQVAAFLNKSIPQRPHERPLDEGPPKKEEDKKTDVKPDVVLVRDCSDHVLRGHTNSGPHQVTPDPRGGSALVLCDMEEDGGGWTVLQRRQDGSVSFNRSWAEYRDGFGNLDGEFWLGNSLIHLLTRDRGMELRVELEDFEGVREYAQYKLFKVASERMRFRLTVDGYTGTAGDALLFNPKYNHNNRAFTTPDRDNDRYPSGNCGAYYSSGWWFDACMAANLNGRYYKGGYKGVRDGIYWGTWHNISTEYYPTNERLSFKTVRMMIRPKGFKP